MESRTSGEFHAAGEKRASGGRIVSIVLDRGHKEAKNVGGVFFEAAFGLLLLIGSPHVPFL